MRSVNKVILIGNLTRDPEMRQTPNGQNVTTFGIATNREWTTTDADKKTSTEFHELVAWAKLAEICGTFLKKGNLVYIEGYLKTRSWDTPEGVKKFKTEVVVQDMIRLEKRPKEDQEIAAVAAPIEEVVEEEVKEVPKKEPEAEEPKKGKEPKPEPTPVPEQAEEEKEPINNKDDDKSSSAVGIDTDLGL